MSANPARGMDVSERGAIGAPKKVRCDKLLIESELQKQVQYQDSFTPAILGKGYN
jgi:hypothetical protein